MKLIRYVFMYLITVLERAFDIQIVKGIYICLLYIFCSIRISTFSILILPNCNFKQTSPFSFVIPILLIFNKTPFYRRIN